MSPAGYSLAVLSSNRLRFADRLQWWGSFRLRSTGKTSQPSAEGRRRRRRNRRNCGRFIPALTPVDHMASLLSDLLWWDSYRTLARAGALGDRQFCAPHEPGVDLDLSCPNVGSTILKPCVPNKFDMPYEDRRPF